MLRSTGFFRGIDCPFNTESYTGRNDGARCNRPYCHFRHSKQTRDSFNPINNRKTVQSFPKQKDTGYDPYNPEVFRPEDRQNGESTSDLGEPAFMDPGALELEMVNRAIEAMRSEVEREQKKLSHIGDHEYDPTTSTIKMGAKRHKSSITASPLEYDPGSYRVTPAADYNPTPRCSKYTLDSDDQNVYASALEYIPTKTVTKKPPPRFPPSPPRSAPLPSPSSKYKYTLDNSKPPTDLEYDPLSNFSARPGSKNNKNRKEQRCVGAVRVEGSKKRFLSTAEEKQTGDDTDSGYIPTKKSRTEPTAAVDTKKYSASFSESDDESSGTEYRPTSISRLQQRRGSAGSVDGAVNVGEGRRERAGAVNLKRQLSSESKEEEKCVSCDTEDSESLELGSLGNQAKGKKMASKSSQKKGSKAETVDGEQKKASKKSLMEKGGDGKKSEEIKKLVKLGFKKEIKSVRSSVDQMSRVKDRDKVKTSAKEPQKPKSNVKSGKLEKLKGECGQERSGGEGGAKKMKGSSKTAKESTRQGEVRNGKLESSRREKEKKGNHGRDGSKEKRSESKPPLDGKAKPSIGKQRSLSHADLFGDESAEEEEEEEGNVVRKSASAFKRRSLISNVKVTSELFGSSEDEGGQEEVRTNDDDDDSDDDDDVGEDDSSSLQMDLDFDSDPLEECLRIFNESKDVKTEDKGRQAKQPSVEAEEETLTESSLTTLFPGQKKRVSHFMSKGSAEPSSKAVVRPYRRPTPQEVCYQRMQIAQRQAVQLAAVVKTTAPVSNPASIFTGERKRVAHRPNPAICAADSAGKQSSGGAVPSQSGAAPGAPSLKTCTFAGILSKTVSTMAQKRVAHTPTLKSSSLQRPVIPTEFGAKVPTNIRQRYLNMFIDECLKFCPSEGNAFQLALEEEKVAYDRSSSRNIYLNVAVNTLKKLRSKSSSAPSSAAKAPAVKPNKKFLSHEEVLGGRLAAKTSFTIIKKGRQPEEELTGATLYKKLKAYVMTEEQLQEHGYPRPHPERSGRAAVYNVQEKKRTDPLAKICCRCGAEYRVTANGNCVRREECTHHWGRLQRHKVAGAWETQYSCCAGLVGSPGCQVAKQHVQDGRKEALDGYVKTFEKPLPGDGNAGVYALDCEMCYTKQGLELTRVTVVDSGLKVIYDTFVKPESKVVDYNTRFSGVTQEDLESTTISLRDVQAVLLSMFSADSILIGHSLESDLFALKLLHSTVVDTAIVFPHRLGLPYKRALRTLMADYLKRIIQDNVEGHDSSEDAGACMQLMLWKIREDAKVKR